MLSFFIAMFFIGNIQGARVLPSIVTANVGDHLELACRNINEIPKTFKWVTPQKAELLCNERECSGDCNDDGGICRFRILNFGTQNTLVMDSISMRDYGNWTCRSEDRLIKTYAVEMAKPTLTKSGDVVPKVGDHIMYSCSYKSNVPFTMKSGVDGKFTSNITVKPGTADQDITFDHKNDGFIFSTTDKISVELIEDDFHKDYVCLIEYNAGWEGATSAEAREKLVFNIPPVLLEPPKVAKGSYEGVFHVKSYPFPSKNQISLNYSKTYTGESYDIVKEKEHQGKITIHFPRSEGEWGVIMRPESGVLKTEVYLSGSVGLEVNRMLWLIVLPVSYLLLM